MHIGIHLTNHLMAEALSHLLVKSGYDHAIMDDTKTAPDVLLVDIATLSPGLLARHPQAKVLLIDTGIEQDKLSATLLSYRIHGILSPLTELSLLKKALTVVAEGQVWIDNGSVKAVLHGQNSVAQAGAITDREREIIDCACQGLRNKEIAQKLAVSPHTVKAHLSRIFRKLNIRSRSKLMTQAMHAR